MFKVGDTVIKIDNDGNHRMIKGGVYTVTHVDRATPNNPEFIYVEEAMGGAYAFRFDLYNMEDRVIARRNKDV